MTSASKVHKGNHYNDISKYVLKVVILKKLMVWNYPYSIAKEMKKDCEGWHGKGILSDVKKSDVYNAINSLEEQGYVSSKTVIKSGRIHKYYKVTKSGLGALKKAMKLRNELLQAFSMLMGEN